MLRAMDPHAFEDALLRDGFTEILRRTLPPGDALPDHAHEWEVRGLVLAGSFHVTGVRRQDCGAGEVFVLPPGEPHSEAAGPEGASLLIGRRHVS